MGPTQVEIVLFVLELVTHFLCDACNDDDNIQQVVKGGGGVGLLNSWSFPRIQHSDLALEQILSLEFYKSLDFKSHLQFYYQRIAQSLNR